MMVESARLDPAAGCAACVEKIKALAEMEAALQLVKDALARAGQDRDAAIRQTNLLAEKIAAGDGGATAAPPAAGAAPAAKDQKAKAPTWTQRAWHMPLEVPGAEFDAYYKREPIK